jgi:hypothetical protein
MATSLPRRLTSVVVLTAVAAVALGWVTYAFVDGRNQQREQQIADRAANAVELTFALIEADLIAAQVAIPSLGGVERAAFEAFATDALRRGLLVSVAYEPIVNSVSRAGWEREFGTAMQARSVDGSFERAAEYPRYAPVQFIYPSNAANRGVIGFDILNDANRKGAALQALRDGRPRMTPPIALAATGEAGLVAFQPLRAGSAESRVTPGIVSSSLDGEAIHERMDAVAPTGTELAIGQGGAMLFGERVEGGTARQIDALGQQLDVIVAVVPPVPPIVPALAVGSIVGLAGLSSGLITRNRRRDAERRRERRLNATSLRVVAEELASASTPSQVIDALDGYLERRLGQPCSLQLTVTEGGRVVSRQSSTRRGWTSDAPADAELNAELPDGGAMKLEIGYPDGVSDQGPLDSIRAVASTAGQALRRSLDAHRQRESLEVLQQSLLPPGLPDIPYGRLGARYITSSSAAVGGDWYEAILLDDGAVVLIIGDVAGRGFPAATTMGQLRVACDVATLDEHASPADVLKRINDYSCRSAGGSTFIGTCLVICVHPDGGASAASAGHLPPILLNGDVTAPWSVATGPALGLVPDTTYPVSRVHVPDGGGLLLMTDGMVERRDEPVDVSIARAARVAGGVPYDDLLDELPDLLHVLRDDDAAMLLLVRQPVITEPTAPDPVPLESTVQ